ncbi:MAG TPA: PQQ-binding-like beta-propeller repeat protein [Planctomycetota bacterium]|nr:PQQ-binding-like beta-propeller repeat protein [Planctomycetota bacterium]
MLKLVPLFCAVAGAAALSTWLLMRNQSAGIQARVSQPDGPGMAPTENSVKAGSKLEHGKGTRSALTGTWPAFRGKDSNGICSDDVVLAKAWPTSGPRVVWFVEMGEGYAGAAIANGCAYVLDYNKPEKCDVLRCLSLGDGQELWRYSYPAKVKPNHGMSRTIPAVTDKVAVTIGPLCVATCVDALSGELLWTKDLVREFKATVPEWYAGQCPLIEGERVILAPGGDALMMAVDCKSGAVIWKTPNPLAWQMTHSSITPVEINGARTYVYCHKSGVAGVSADDGRLLWQSDLWTIQQATIASPVSLGDGKILLSGGYGSGALMLEIREENGVYAVKELFRLKPQIFGSYQHTPIFYQGNIYGVRPDGQMTCLDREGRVLWSSGKERFGKEGGGPYTLANGFLFAMDDNGLLTLIDATPAAYKKLAQSQILNGSESWAPMAIASGRLIARDLARMICLDISVLK